MKPLSLNRDYPFALDVVWMALVENDRISEVFIPPEYRRQESSDEEFATTARVMSCISQQRLEVVIPIGPVLTTVTFELSRANRFTRIEFVHAGFSSDAFETRAVFSAWWKRVFDRGMPARCRRVLYALGA